MKYREYRRKCKETKDSRAKKVSSFTYKSGYRRYNKLNPQSERFDKYSLEDESCDYVIRRGRSSYSSELKRIYNKKLRNSSKLNMTPFKGKEYKRASGDFWWDYV